MSTFATVAALPVAIESVELERLSLRVSDEFTRVTTIVHLRGAGEKGIGEDVTYAGAEHDDPPVPDLVRRWDSFEALSRSLDRVELFRGEPEQDAYREYRRWAWESAALDLALRQAGTSLAAAVGRELRPVRFVVSMRLPDPPTAGLVRRWLDLYPWLQFKLDPTSGWTDELVDELAGTGAVESVDLKGAYKGTVVDQPPDPDLYRRVAERLPRAWIEDPNLDHPEAAAALEPHRERITWDAPIRSVADIEALPFPPRTINVKPSRFGSVRKLFDAYDWCGERGIGLYGGGQWELGAGRGQIQYLASLFHPDMPNDVAPRGYNGPPQEGLPESPLEVQAHPTGFRWG